MKADELENSICGLWESGGKIHICLGSSGGARQCCVRDFSPFIWSGGNPVPDSAESVEILKGPDSGIPKAPLDRILRFKNRADMDAYFKSRDKSIPAQRISSVENQYLCHARARMFAGMDFDSIMRLQLDIEVCTSGSFPDARNSGDRIIAVGLSGVGGRKILEIEGFSDESERKLLEALNAEILSRDPDIIEGHNIFKFDLPYLNARCKRLKVPLDWGRFNLPVEFRKSRLSIAERSFAYTRCDIPGRTVVDTLLLVQLYDLSAREMPSYTLKASAVHFGISNPDTRTYIDGDKISDAFISDRETFREYLFDDLRETAALSERLLPTYVAQVRNFPLTLQECLLRGSGMKVESVFLEKYYAARAALPLPQESTFIEGALSESFKTGVFENVLHYDVASLYPSLMLLLKKYPRNDYLGTFLPELEKLRSYRLKYKRLSREAEDLLLRREYDARQKSFKILINSFYGYLGLGTATFGDTQLAAEITAMGRRILSDLIKKFSILGCSVLEADTDGIYVSSGEYFAKAGDLLSKVSSVLPEGVELEFDGSYDAMLCYKAKNYALLDSGKVLLRGSALRNRSTEPYLRALTETLVRDKLLGKGDAIISDIEKAKQKILSGNADIFELAKGEFISKSPAQYESDISKTGRGRRAAMEAALLMNPRPEVGEKVLYYIAAKEGSKKAPDWSRALPVSMYDPVKAPYDAEYYIKKADDLLGRFSEILGDSLLDSGPRQGELF